MFVLSSNNAGSCRIQASSPSLIDRLGIRIWQASWMPLRKRPSSIDIATTKPFSSETVCHAEIGGGRFNVAVYNVETSASAIGTALTTLEQAPSWFS